MGEFLKDAGSVFAAPFTGGASLAGLAIGNKGDSGNGDTPMPNYPGLVSILNPDGTLKSEDKLSAQPDVGFNSTLPGIQTGLDSIQLNMDPLHQLEQYGNVNNTALSPWAQAQTAAQQQQQALQSGGAGTQANAARASSMDNLAAHGGLSTGAAERMGINSNNNLINTQQNIAGQGILARLGIQSQDDQNKLAALEALPGQEVNALQPALQKQSLYDQAAQYDQGQKQSLDLANRNYTTGVQQANIGNQLAGNQQQNAYNMGLYQTQAQTAAANNTANAIQNQGKK